MEDATWGIIWCKLLLVARQNLLLRVRGLWNIATQRPSPLIDNGGGSGVLRGPGDWVRRA